MWYLAIVVMGAAVVASAVVQPAAATTGAVEADFHVSPRGDDAWSGEHADPDGQAAGPFATIERAQAAVRELREAEPDRQRPIVVAVRGGRYELERPIVFRPADSGSEAAPVIYQAYRDEEPVFSGGRAIENWQVDEQGWWRANLPESEAADWTFTQLFVDDQRRFRPHLPREGYFHIEREVEATEAHRERGHDRFGYRAGDIQPDWADRDEIEILAFHFWGTSRMRIADIDADERIVRFTGPTWTREWYGGLPEDHRYRVVNVREALGEPGDWYLDRSGDELIYVPREGETPVETRVVAPRLKQLVVFEGDLDGRQWVEHLHLRGLTFAHTNWTVPEQGDTFPQAAIHTGVAVGGLAARHVVLEACAVRHTGGYAIAFGPGSRHNRIEACEIADMGAGGILIGMGAGLDGSYPTGQGSDDDPESHVTHHLIRDNTIAHGGRLHPAGVGIWIGQSAYNRIEHNHIFDLYYTGLSVGWSWGYRETRTHDNELAYNHVHHIGQGVLSDMGGVYTLGVQPNTRIHHNRFHDITSHTYGGWGLYTDEGSSDLVMEKNLVYRTTNGGFHQHFGRDNQIRNNIFVDGQRTQIERGRAEDHRSFVFERNIVAWQHEAALFGGNWEGDGFEMDRNIYWNAGRPIVFADDLTFEQWQQQRGQDPRSRVADPRFVAPDEDDFRLHDDSPALHAGFEPFDLDAAGRQTPPRLLTDLPDVPAAFE